MMLQIPFVGNRNFQFVELHRKCRVVTIRKKLIKLHIKLTKD